MSQESLLPAVAGRILGWLLPACCLACRAPVSSLRIDCGLCSASQSRLAPVEPGDVCTICGLCGLRAGPLPSGEGSGERAGSICAACRVRRPAYDRLLAAWWYQPPLDAVIQDFKFRRLDYLGGHLARTMAERLRPALADMEGRPSLVSHVPLHWRRRLARGYDQARAIAVPLARALDLPFRSTLRRRRSTPAQSSLDRAERRANLEEVFAVRNAGALAGRRVFLVDDVATTGATLEAAARTLKEQGASEVVGLVAARTPLRLEPR